MLRLGSVHRMGQEKGVPTPVISTCLRALTVRAGSTWVCLGLECSLRMAWVQFKV